jgi:hypothetical protein
VRLQGTKYLSQSFQRPKVLEPILAHAGFCPSEAQMKR